VQLSKESCLAGIHTKVDLCTFRTLLAIFLLVCSTPYFYKELHGECEFLMAIKVPNGKFRPVLSYHLRLGATIILIMYKVRSRENRTVYISKTQPDDTTRTDE
jgi:hypothetical protein